MADDATERDLRIAMRTLEEYFVVGLTERMDESLSRFNAVLRIDENNPTTKICKMHFFFDSVGVRKTNSVAHPVVSSWFLLFRGVVQLIFVISRTAQ